MACISTAQTNSLEVSFVEGFVTFASAHEQLAIYGEIAHLDLPSGSFGKVLVSYYDRRAAGRALAALGDLAVPAPQHGDCIVWLTGDAEVLPWMLPEIAGVRRSADKSGAYALEFFDTRCAERAAKQVREGVAAPLKASLSMDGGVRGGSSTAAAAAPRKVPTLRLAELNWADVRSGRDQRTTMRLSCLPPKFNTTDALQAELTNAGLSDAVDVVRVVPTAWGRPGAALINAVNSEGVLAVGQHFHGRRWGRSLPVSVSFAVVQGATEVRQRFPEDGPRRPLLLSASTAEPWHVRTAPLGSEKGLPAKGDLSEVSTEAGDEAELVANDAGTEVGRRLQVQGSLPARAA